MLAMFLYASRTPRDGDTAGDLKDQIDRDCSGLRVRCSAWGCCVDSSTCRVQEAARRVGRRAGNLLTPPGYCGAVVGSLVGRQTCRGPAPTRRSRSRARCVAAGHDSFDRMGSILSGSTGLRLVVAGLGWDVLHRSTRWRAERRAPAAGAPPPRDHSSSIDRHPLGVARSAGLLTRYHTAFEQASRSKCSGGAAVFLETPAVGPGAPEMGSRVRPLSRRTGAAGRRVRDNVAHRSRADAPDLRL